MNQDNPNQLFLGTYRLYRTDNAKARLAPATSGGSRSAATSRAAAPGAAPNGGRGCFISADRHRRRRRGRLHGLRRGLRLRQPGRGQTSDNPTWTRVGNALPEPAGQRVSPSTGSNYRIAYVAFEGFNAGYARPAGARLQDDRRRQTSGRTSAATCRTAPVNSLVLDPSYPNTLYAGTDVGPFVTYDGGQTWQPLGTGFPTVAIWQLDFDPSQAGAGRSAPARTAGRRSDARRRRVRSGARPVARSTPGVPVGPSSTMTTRITSRTSAMPPRPA